MVERIIDFSARNRFIVFLFVFGLAMAGWWAMRNIPIDAIPDISDTQVIIYTTWMGRSPDLVEDQITYPIVTALLSAPRVTVVRGFSDFGFSYVYVLFKDGTDIYWARSRVLEYMNQLAGRLPEGVTPQLGPDATAVGWVFQYALVDESGQHDLAALRSFQDWSLRYWLRSVDGVAEVASVGGFVRQYQITLDPTKLLAYNLALPQIIDKIRMSNNDVGGRVVEFAGTEYMIRGRGYIKSRADIERIAVGVNARMARRSCCAMSRQYGSARTCGGGWSNWTARGSGRWDRGDALRGERAPGHRAPQGQAQGARACHALRRQGCDHV